jgi:hypothetical protein
MCVICKYKENVTAFDEVVGVNQVCKQQEKNIRVTNKQPVSIQRSFLYLLEDIEL